MHVTFWTRDKILCGKRKRQKQIQQELPFLHGTPTSTQIKQWWTRTQNVIKLEEVLVVVVEELDNGSLANLPKTLRLPVGHPVLVSAPFIIL